MHDHDYREPWNMLGTYETTIAESKKALLRLLSLVRRDDRTWRWGNRGAFESAEMVQQKANTILPEG